MVNVPLKYLKIVYSLFPFSIIALFAWILPFIVKVNFQSQPYTNDIFQVRGDK